ncbi:hypothetical protein [Porticoccus sp.]
MSKHNKLLKTFRQQKDSGSIGTHYTLFRAPLSKALGVQMKIPLKIETHDRRLGFEMAGIDNKLSSGTVVDVPGGAKLQYESTFIRKSFGIPEILEFIVEASVTIDLSLLAAWLYQKVQGKEVEKIIIRNTEITEINEDNIRKVLEQEITIER